MKTSEKVGLYRTVGNLSANTNSPAELLDSLFVRTLDHLYACAAALESSRQSDYHKSLDRAITLIDQGLIDSLDVTTELGATLLTTYTSLMLLLVKANADQDVDLINQSIDIVKMIRSSFESANQL